MWLGLRFSCLSGKTGKDEEPQKKQEIRETCNHKLKTFKITFADDLFTRDQEIIDVR